MQETILFVDGQNFLNKVEQVLKAELGLKDGEFNKLRLDYTKLFEGALTGLKVDKKRFYAAKIKWHPDTPRKSRALIESQRLLKSKLEGEGFEFIVAGAVRANYPTAGKKILTFKEKGVDVQIAVDNVSLSCDGELGTSILASSDSDLQPAVRQLKKRSVQVVYVGFEIEPNKGLIYTSDRAILLRNSEVVSSYTK